MREKLFEKKHGSILAALYRNLANVEGIFQIGDNPRNIVKHSKVRNEGQGLYSIDQRGAQRKVREARIYFYPNFETSKVYLLTIGFKETQRRDILSCRKCISKLKKELKDG